MSSAGSRAFSASAKAALKYTGSTTAELVKANPGETGKKVAQAVKNIEASAEEQFPTKAHTIHIKGTTLHKSTKDPEETQKVISIAVKTAGGTRLASYHAREDGTISGPTITRAGGGKMME